MFLPIEQLKQFETRSCYAVGMAEARFLLPLKGAVLVALSCLSGCGERQDAEAGLVLELKEPPAPPRLDYEVVIGVSAEAPPPMRASSAGPSPGFSFY